MKTKLFLLTCFLFLLLLCPLYNFAEPEYRELNTSAGKVIVGLDREGALEKFGLPAQASERLWYYSSPESLFVLFFSQSFSKIYLYPQHPHGSPGMPLEFRAFGYQSDMKLRDITQDVRLLIDRPKDFILGKGGVIIPRKAGEYQVLAKYKNIFSNSAYIKIEESLERETKKEELISIKILPYRPVIPYQGQLDFMALGVFRDSSGRYTIRDITRKAKWYVKQDKEIIKNKDNKLFGLSLGKAELFCRYLNLDSYPMEVYVQEQISAFNQTLKHIMLMPELILAALGKNIDFKVFATYRNNSIEDITHKVTWEISNKNTLTLMKGGEFTAKDIGIAEVTAALYGLKSGSAKVIVVDKQKQAFLTSPPESKINPKRLSHDIQKEAEKLKEDLAKEEKKLTLIKITPDALEISLGETREVKALGIYSDKSEEDLTHLGEWSSSDDKIVKVAGGKIGTFLQGEAMIYIKFKDIKSMPAVVKVGGPKLVSIILSPQNLRISMEDKTDFKAEGYFSDSSRKEITSLVTWEFSRLGIIMIKEDKIIPLKFGKTEVFAEYSGIKSLPANITIIITIGWVMHMIMKWAVFLFLGITVMFIALYVLTEKKKRYLRSFLDKSPKDFVINLFENIKGILGIFNVSHKEWMTPFSYAERVQKKYSIEGNIFLNFIEKFEEAKYSNHSLSPEDATRALSDYNDLLKTMLGRHNKVLLFFKYCLTLLHRRPLLIPNP
ncbi:MAG: DUF4129 domain-containing protein [Candidatus Omnitrophota bacterium]